jgi:cytoskeleton protein RodZ
MTPEEDDNQTNESSDHEAAVPRGGQRLAEARHARGISVLDIAKELHLDEAKVRALEENHFDVLGAPVFAKGHMRKYAELVGVPIDDILADYYQLNRATGAPPVVGRPRKVPREISIGPWVAGLVVIVVVALAAWWWFNLEPMSEPVTAEPESLAPFESERQDDTAADVDDGTLPLDGTVPAPSTDERQTPLSVPAEETESLPIETAAEQVPDLVVQDEVPDTAGAPAASNVELVLSFGGDCWTEVTDATGRRLFFGLGTPGRVVTLNGVEPLGVLLGDSTNVSIQVNGFDYRIPAANRRGNTARLTIYGQ